MFNRALILSLIAITTVIFCFAGMKSDREELRLVGDVKSVVINENDRPTIRYEFLATVGNLFAGYTYKDDGTIDYVIKPGATTASTDTTEATKTFIWTKGLKTVYKRVDHYDEAGNVVGYSYFDASNNNTEFVKQSYKYDISGNKDERGTGITDAKKNKVEKFAYDNMGNIIEKAEYINGTKAREFKYSYEFDLEGNWTKRTVDSKDIAAGQTRYSRSSVTTRNFTYFTLKNPPPPVIDPVQQGNNFGFADSVHVLGNDVVLPTDSKSTLVWRLTGNVPTIKAGDFLTAGDVAKNNFNFIRAVESVVKNTDGSVTVTTQRVPPTSLPRRKPGDPTTTDPGTTPPIDPTPVVPRQPTIRLKENCKAILATTDAVKIAGLDTKDKIFTKITFSQIDTQPQVGSYLYLGLNPPVVNEEKYLKVEAAEQKYGVTVVTASDATPFDILRPTKPGRPGLVQYKNSVQFTKVLADYDMRELTENSIAFLDPAPSWKVGDIVVLDQTAPPPPPIITTPGNPGMVQPQPQPMPTTTPNVPGIPGVGGSISNERKILKVIHPVTGVTVFETTQAEPSELYNEIAGYKYPKLQPKIIPGIPGLPGNSNGPGPNYNPNDMPLILTPDMPYVFKRITTVNNIQMAIFEAPGPQVNVGRKIIIPATTTMPEISMIVSGAPIAYGNNIGFPVTVENNPVNNNDPNGNPVTQPVQPVQPPKPTIKAGVKLLGKNAKVAYYNEITKLMILRGDIGNLRKGDLVVYEGTVVDSVTKANIQGIYVRITSVPPIGGVLRYGFEKVSKDEVYDQPQPTAVNGGNMGAAPNANNAIPKTVGPVQQLPPIIVPYF